MPENLSHSVTTDPARGGESIPPAGRAPETFSEESFFFGSDDAPLYGVLHLPAKPAARAPIIHVHAFGIEQIASYRLEVEFARAAASQGFPVMRFHMRGAGDSWGDPAHLTLDTMAADVRSAAEHLRARGFATTPALLGVRLGCDVALRAALAFGGVRALILWEPTAGPRAYLESVLRSRIISALAQGEQSGETVASLVETLRAEGVVDLLGYPIHRALYESALPFSAPAGVRLAPEAAIVSIGRRARVPQTIAALSTLLDAAGTRCDLIEVREEPAWQFNANPSFVSDALVDATLAWCVSHLGASS